MLKEQKCPVGSNNMFVQIRFIKDFVYWEGLMNKTLLLVGLVYVRIDFHQKMS